MPTTYPTGYGATRRTLAELQQWPEWQHLDPEMQRRLLALMDAAAAAGRPVGIGDIFRTDAEANALFLQRHHEVKVGDHDFERSCCSHEGKRYALNAGQAHAASAKATYHGATTPEQKALAADLTGDLAFVAENAARFGLIEFSKVNNEPWHVQPADVPKGRSQYKPAVHHPLKPWPLPGTSTPPPPVATSWPDPTVRRSPVRSDRANQLQRALTSVGIDVGRADGLCGPRTVAGILELQRRCGFVGEAVDGVYGPNTCAAARKKYPTPGKAA